MYVCSRCDKCFNRKRDYDRHLLRKRKCSKPTFKREENPQNQCDYCKKTFANPHNLKRHSENTTCLQLKKQGDMIKLLLENQMAHARLLQESKSKTAHTYQQYHQQHNTKHQQYHYQY